MSNKIGSYVKNLWDSVFSSDDSAGIDNNKQDLDRFIEDFYSQFKPEVSLPEVPVYEKMDFQGLSDEELAKRAENDLSLYKNENINAIDKEHDATLDRIENDKKSVSSSVDEKKATINSAFESAKESTSNDSLKRGLARSSIAINKMAGLDNAQAEAISRAASEYQERIVALEQEINGLSVKREKALNDFNISYASKLTTMINGLKDEQEKNRIEAIKYNNTIAQKEFEQQSDKQKNEANLTGQHLKNLQLEGEAKKMFENELNTAVYNRMRDMLSGVSPGKAKELIRNDEYFKNNVSSEFYYKLYDEFGR